MAVIIRDEMTGIEACVGSVSDGAGGRIIALGIRSRSLGGRFGAFRIGPFETEIEAHRAIDDGVREMFGARSLETQTGDLSFPAWFLSVSLYVFPAMLSAAVGAAMVVAALRALDGDRPVRDGLGKVWKDRRHIKAPQKSAAPSRPVTQPAPVEPAPVLPAQVERQAASVESKPAMSAVVEVRETKTTAPWAPAAAMAPVGFLKATWLRRPSQLDKVLDRLRD